MSNCFISPGVSLLPHAANKQLAFAQPELDLEQLLAKEEEMLLKKLDAVRNVKVLPPIGVTAAPENETSIEEEEEQEDSFEDDEGEIDEEIEGGGEEEEAEVEYAEFSDDYDDNSIA